MYKRVLSLLLAVMLAVSMAACGEDGADATTGTAAPNTAETVTYTVHVKTNSGIELADVGVYIYADSTMADMKQYGKTDDKGSVSFQLPVSSDYAIKLEGVSDGYKVDAHYTFSGNTANITLKSEGLVTSKSLSEVQLGLGDVMCDFEVTTPAGETIKLSEVLKEKKLVVLNFWYTGCSWCIKEFPVMEKAYQIYGEDVEIIALDPMNETNDAIAAFPAANGLELSFPLAACPNAWANTFSISGYPTSVFVDRYGVICAIEAGAITSLRPFSSAFDHFIAEDYQQKLCQNGISELVTAVKPTFQMDTPENVAAIMNGGEIQATYHAEEGNGKELSWPFIEAEKLGQKCLKASNQDIDDSFAILYANVELKAGQAVGFDYLTSSELGSDILHVIVDGELIYSISGVGQEEVWQRAFPCVADKDGTYEIAFSFLKDGSDAAGDDTVYIRNLHITDASAIDTPTYLARPAATTEDEFTYEYVQVVYNEADGYYHVGTADGPLLLAELMGTTAFNEENSVWNMTADGMLKVGGKDYTEAMTRYCNYASNTKSTTLCTVNQELYDLLHVVDQVAGFDEQDDKEWLRLCKYYEAYGTNGVQMTDPIAGLAPFSAFQAKEGKNVPTNFFYYDRIIMPRGMLAEFKPSRSGVYRITSRTDDNREVEGWIFDENLEQLFVYEHQERMYDDQKNVSMLYYMEAGKSYYIDIAFWDVYGEGNIYYDIEYVGTKAMPFMLCSPGYFTYDSNATGDAMYYLITEGPKVVLRDDGYYYEDLGKDSSGNQRYGSKIFCDFVGNTSIFPNSTIATVGQIEGMIDLGGFDFSKTEQDLEILSYLEENNGDEEATRKYLKTLWNEEYDANAKEYKIDDVFAGRYHGEGPDLTREIRMYLDKMETSGDHRGCVAVDERLAEILQMLMDKYVFADVENSWLKLCYYYKTIGPND